MLIKRLGRAAAWLTVAVLAGATTLTTGMLMVLGAYRGWSAALGRFADLFWPGLLILALAPWWAMVVVALERERDLSRGRR